MGICSTVRDATDAIAAAKPLVKARYQRQAEILRRMPSYAQSRDLATWEQAFMSLVDDQATETEESELLWEVFEFGRFNLYSNIRKAETESALQRLAEFLNSHGVGFTGQSSVEEW
jgi:hypothetical protein